MRVIKKYNSTTRRYENNSTVPTSHELLKEIQILKEQLLVATAKLSSFKRVVSQLNYALSA